MRPGLLIAAVTLAALSAGAASAASFDCGKARTSDEKAICATLSLNDQDVRMSQLYGIVRKVVPMGARGAIMDDQAVWLRDRRKCGADKACLSRSYSKRIAQLYAVLEHFGFRNPMDLGGAPRLTAFMAEWGARESARATPYVVDTRPA